MARPTKFKDEYKHICHVMCKLGATDDDLAEACKVTDRTIDNWKTANPEFFRSIKKGKDFADSDIVKSLFQRAKGYSHPDTKFATHEGIITDQKEFIKHYPPDTGACIYWLNNRLPKKWNNKHMGQGEEGSESIDGLKISFVDENDKTITPKFQITKSAED